MATPRKPRRRQHPTAGGGSGRPGRARNPAAAEASEASPEAIERPLPSLAAERARRARPAVIFEALATLLAPYAHLFEAEMHERMGYCLKTYGEWPDEIYFAGVQWTERGLFYHLFPIAGHPEIVAELSPALRAHREGRVSFRFETFEPRLFTELVGATARAYQSLTQDGLLAAA